MNISAALSYAVSVVNGSEGFTPAAFLDTLAKPPVWTIGHGTTRVMGNPVREGMTCTRAQADLWAMADMAAAAHFVLTKVTVPLNEWQLAALISFCYNIGDGNFEHSTVLEALNFRMYGIAADRLLEYDEAGGKTIKGLETRRGRERALFLIGMGTYVNPGLPVLHRAETPALVPQRPLSAGDADVLNAAELKRLDDPLTS